MELNYNVYLVHNPFNPAIGLTYLSGAIRYGTNSQWNHIAIEVELEGIIYIVEAVAEGVIRTPKDEWLLNATRFVQVLEPINTTINFHELFMLIGEEYDYPAIAYIAWDLLLMKIGRKGSPYDGKVSKKLWDGIFCSELLAILEHRANPHQWYPCHFEHDAAYRKGKLFMTYKIDAPKRLHKVS